MSIDPGPHTGIVKYYPDRRVGNAFVFNTLDFTDKGMHDANLAHSTIYDMLLDEVHTGDTDICEKFEYQKEKAKFREHLNFDAAEYVGVVKVWFQRQGTFDDIKFVMQSPSTAVGDSCFWTDDKLKKLGLYKQTLSRHERDALRHLLYYLAFTKGEQSWLHLLK
jgi:hypothetical protein